MAKFTKTDHCINCLDCNKNLPLLQLLSPSELEELNASRFEVKFKAGETIFKQGTSATHLLILTSGLAKFYVEGVQEKQLIIKIIKPWEIVGQASLYFDNRHHYSVAALVDCTACFIEIESFKKMIRQNSDFAEEFIKKCTQKGIYSFEKMVSLSQKQMHGRIADGLLYLSDRIYESDSFLLHLSRQDIADLTGMSKDSAIRILKEFHHEGIIELDGRKLNIINSEQLERISETG
ncbi:Crp/Fnr family transcriptional regulator [Marinifilum caeruleilacunae]|uniref:Crp/Fnr family transcriptional regulator n=1 Tax=Marinifilum caeruleilacunae TaxID=2499076 RepID=A0ABX1X119_9BACT|nr:Crp/Fnr family transcriptional regulator [Marinifilum caeruleilacunae]NOU61911.1 Crp/Fnr family transcriptional regulator [Marinifilum caeruleilacunae]